MDVLRATPKAVEDLGQQEVAADAAGLEPGLGGARVQGLLGYFRRPAVGKTRADLPVNVGTIMALALPTLVESLLSAGIGFTDTIVAGHTGETAELRAAAAASVGAVTYLGWLAGL